MLAPPPLPRTLEAALRDLSSAKPAVRSSAIRDLVPYALADEGLRATAIPRLESALRSDDSAEVRAAAAVALADLRAGEALPALLVAVEDAHAHVRQMALSALGEIGDARALARLKRALSDDRPEVRYQAVIAFARVAAGDAGEVSPALCRALGDADENIRYIALRSAEEHALGAGHDALASRAEELLASKVAPVSLAAAIYLARREAPCGDPARAVLLRAVRGELKGIAIEDEQAAVELAGVLELRAAEPHLERRAWGLGRIWRGEAASAWHARVALARLGNARAKGEILRDLGSWRRETRDAAVVAAGRARLLEARPVILALAADRADPRFVAEALGLLEGDA